MIKTIMYAGEDIFGKKYGKLTVAKKIGRDANNHLSVECRCDCGTVKIIHVKSLNTRQIISCGCHRKKAAHLIGKNNETHGKSLTPEYMAWYNMRRTKCGVEVCERWLPLENFSNFLQDMGLRPSSFYYLARIDAEKDFTPENCEWRHREERYKQRRHKVHR